MAEYTQIPDVTVDQSPDNNGEQEGSQQSDYDPRRLFPFGLSPIPEVPSELASGDSTACVTPTPNNVVDDDDQEWEDYEYEEDDDDDEDDGSDTEVESLK